MEATNKNQMIIKKILTVIANEKCTVRESREILSFTQQFLEYTTVQDLTEQMDKLFSGGITPKE